VALVTISDGVLKGSEENGIHSFKGIPYAAAISGENRWLPPKPPEPWAGERDTTSFGNICPQQAPPNRWLAGKAGRLFIDTIWYKEPVGDNCLNLNVWTPTLDPEADLPVMYWIHGGAFTTGSGSLNLYDGTNLAKKEVVVVSINYRLGMIGSFIAPGMYDDDFCVPNRGFLDQVAGLRWVKENIGNFGGNPNQVTIFGESAGGQSVAVLLASPATKGLFQRAILQSGTPEIGTPVSDHERFAIDLLDAMGVEKGSRAALSGLSAQDTVDAAKITMKLIPKGSEKKYGDLAIFGNVGCIYGDDFLPQNILESLKQGQGKGIDLMIGTVLEDGRLFPLVMPGPEPFSSWMCMGFLKGMFKPKNEPKLVFDRYKKVMTGASKNAIRGQIFTDSMFRRGTVKVAEIHSAARPGRTYLYQFNWSSPVLNGAIGAIHAIDVPFTNLNLEPFARILGDIETLRGMADTVSDAWVNFAKTGKPTSTNLPEWEPFDVEKRATMVFNTNSEMQYDVDKEMREIWDG